MNIRDPRQYERIRAKQQGRKRSLKVVKVFVITLIVAVMGVSGMGYVAYARPLPTIDPSTDLPSVAAEQVALAWPGQGQAAVGTLEGGFLDATPVQQSLPTASVTKVMVAYAVLKKKPIAPGEEGPLITVTPADVQRYNDYIAVGGSVAPVTAGQQISEYQALQMMLLPSANNVADMLAVWAFGSLDSYFEAASQYAVELGMTQTTFGGDASGLSPLTKSTPKDLVLLGSAALRNPVIAGIVSKSSAVFAGTGTLYNTNYLLGNNGFVGIKTGNTDEAGGCFLFASEQKLENGKKVTVVGVIMGAPDRYQAINHAPTLVQSVMRNFVPIAIAKKNQVVGSYNVPWTGEDVDVYAAEDMAVWGWKGKIPSTNVQLNQLSPSVDAGTVAGTIVTTTSVDKVSVNVLLSKPIQTPDWQWRILRN